MLRRVARSSSPSEPDPALALSPGVSRGTLPVRGRDDVLLEIDRALDAPAVSVVVLVGGPGIGKTRLLEETIAAARRRGWCRVIVAPTPDSRTTPLGALTDAALAASPPLLDAAELAPVLLGSHPQYWITRLLHDGIERAATSRGLLFVIDDLQWLDAGSVGAVAALMRTTVGMPVTWLIGTRPGGTDAGQDRLLSYARDVGALIELEPLTDAAVREIGGDVLGMPAGPVLADALGAAEGSPLLALEMLYGLSDENLIDVTGGTAEIVDSRVPRGFGASSRRRLAAVSADARRVAQAGALFGRRFGLPGVVSVLDLPLASALASVDELLAADIVADDGTGLVFRHDTIRDAALESLSPSLRRALGRAVLEKRRAEGVPAAALAPDLLRFAERGDDESIALLLDAARELAATDAQTAASLVARAAELAPATERYRAEIVELLPVLWAGGRADEVAAIGDRFSASLGGDERARVDLVMARLFTESSFERALEICDRALEIPDASPATRVQLLAVRALNCANAADPEGLRDSIRRGRAEADDRRDLVALATLDASESVLTFYESRFDDALRLQRDALRRIADSGTLASLWLPEGLWMAFMRNSLGECRAALRDVDTGLAEARRAHNVIAEAFWMMVRARVLYDLGALEDARTQAEAVLDLASELQLGDFANATAGVVLFRISLHTGDRVLRDQTRPLVTALAEGRGLTRTGRWNLAVEALDAGRFDDARALSSLALQGLDQPAPAMTTPADLLDDLLLAEVCLGARDTDALDRVRVTVAARADANPDRPAVQAVELAVRGLADRSESLLRESAVLCRAGQRPLVLARVLEVLASVLVGDEEAARTLTEALDVYQAVGATRDASRVLRSLRARGVRTRPKAASTADPAGLGLSQREQQVADVLRTGATTKEISEALLLSPHTVVTHVRHIFAKLGVNTRSEVIEILSSAHD